METSPPRDAELRTKVEKNGSEVPRFAYDRLGRRVEESRWESRRVIPALGRT